MSAQGAHIVHGRDNLGNTTAMMACSNRMDGLAILDVLIEHGVDLTLKTTQQNFSCFNFAFCSSAELVAKLIPHLSKESIAESIAHACTPGKLCPDPIAVQNACRNVGYVFNPSEFAAKKRGLVSL